MSDEQKTTSEKPRDCCEGMPSTAMMEKMMSRCAEMMPQIMAMCGGAQNDQDDKEETATDAAQKA